MSDAYKIGQMFYNPTPKDATDTLLYEFLNHKQQEAFLLTSRYTYNQPMISRNKRRRN